jgi:hypothetical protein
MRNWTGKRGKHFQEGFVELQVPRLPGFPVKSCGFSQVHVVSLERTTSVVAGERSEAGNPGALGQIGEGCLKERAVAKGEGSR